MSVTDITCITNSNFTTLPFQLIHSRDKQVFPQYFLQQFNYFSELLLFAKMSLIDFLPNPNNTVVQLLTFIYLTHLPDCNSHSCRPYLHVLLILLNCRFFGFLPNPETSTILVFQFTVSILHTIPSFYFRQQVAFCCLHELSFSS